MRSFKWLLILSLLSTRLILADSYIWPPSGTASGGPGGGTVTSVEFGPVGNSPNADGGLILDPTTTPMIILEPATAGVGASPSPFPGIVSVGTQSFSGSKTIIDSAGQIELNTDGSFGGNSTGNAGYRLYDSVLSALELVELQFQGNSVPANFVLATKGSSIASPATSAFVMGTDPLTDNVNDEHFLISYTPGNPADLVTVADGTGTADDITISAAEGAGGEEVFSAGGNVGLSTGSAAASSVSALLDGTNGYLTVNPEAVITDGSSGYTIISPINISFEDGSINPLGFVGVNGLPSVPTQAGIIIKDQTGGNSGFMEVTAITAANPHEVLFGNSNGTCAVSAAGSFSCTNGIVSTPSPGPGNDTSAWHDTLDPYPSPSNKIGTNASGAPSVLLEAHGTLVATVEESSSVPLLLVNGHISNPGSGTTTEGFGASTVTPGTNQAAFGNDIVLNSGNTNYAIFGNSPTVNASPTAGTGIGNNLNLGVSNCTLSGYAATCTGTTGTYGPTVTGANSEANNGDSTVDGAGSTANGGGIALGAGISAGNSICIGLGCVGSASNVLIAGSPTYYLTDVWFGNGNEVGLPSHTGATQAVVIHASDYSNGYITNGAGAQLTLVPGTSSGNGTAAAVEIDYGIQGASSGTSNQGTAAGLLVGQQTYWENGIRTKGKNVNASTYQMLITDRFLTVQPASGGTTITLLASPPDGTEIEYVDTSGGATANNITVLPSSGNINGSSSNVCILNYCYRKFRYSTISTQWNITGSLN